MTIGNEYYVASAASASELDFTGYGEYTVNVTLSEQAVIDLTAALEEKGYDVTALSDVLDTTAVADEFTVIVMNRGDANLDNKDNSSSDAVMVLRMYNYASIMNYTLEEMQEFLEMDDVSFKAACYAADIDADQTIRTQDAIYSLTYYNRNYIQNEPATWDELVAELGRVDFTGHEYAQHVDPLSIFSEQ